jgi:hypothetical protein
MPWPLWIFLPLWALMAIPVAGTALAIIIAFVTLPLVAPVIYLTEPLIQELMARGIRRGPAAIAGASVIVGPLVLFCLYRSLRPGLTGQQRSRAVNWLILVAGVPLTIALAWWLTPNKFG